VTLNSCSVIIENALRRIGSLQRIKAELSVYYWPRVAGVEIAKKVTALRYCAGYLYLKTESPTLAHQVTMLNWDIVKRYQHLLGSGVIKGIKIKIGSVDLPKEKIGDNAISGLDQKEQEFVASNCRKIADPEVAEGFQRMMKQALLANHKKQAEGFKPCLSCDVLIDRGNDYCPVCETKLQNELQCYINYLQRNHREVDLKQLPFENNEANKRLLKKILSLNSNNFNGRK
jgi:hypothetical protein